MKDILMNILTNLYGESICEDLEEHIALLKEINNYNRRKRIAIEQQSKIDFINLANILRKKYPDICCYFNDNTYWDSEWFNKDYDKALIEVEQQQPIPSDRELCILRLAREAKYKGISLETIFRFCKEYLIDGNEYTIFWVEYCNANNHE